MGDVVFRSILSGETGRCSAAETAQSCADSHAVQYGSIAYELCQGSLLLPALERSHGSMEPRDIVAIERIRILPAFRCRGIGTQVIRSLVAMLQSAYRLIVLKPFPLDWHGMAFEDSEAGRKQEEAWFARQSTRLEDFYRRFGFQPVAERFMAYPAQTAYTALAHSSTGMRTCSTISSPKPSSAGICMGVFDSKRMR